MSPETTPSPEPDSLSELASSHATPFPQFSRFPAEIQIMIWEQYVQIDRASRVVFVTSYTGLSTDESKQARNARIPIPQGLRILPSRRLASPLLSVDSQSRAVALGHYRTRIELYQQHKSHFEWDMVATHEDLGWKMQLKNEDFDRDEYDKEVKARGDAWVRPDPERDLEWWSPRERQSCRFPASPEWVRRGRRVREIEIDLGLLAPIAWEEERVDETAHRGCVYLDPATDRFLDWWDGHFSWAKPYGLRALYDAFLGYKYHGTPFDLRDILERRQRPAPLRYYSAGLSDDVLGQIRHMVFSNDPRGGRIVDGRNRYLHKVCRKLCPKAWGPEGTISSFHSSEEMERTFLDDVEDKGAEYLQIREVKTKLVPVPGRWKEVVVLEPLS